MRALALPGFWLGLVFAFIILFLFYKNLRDLLLRVSPQRRTMSPSHVWLNFIPIFKWYWLIRTVAAVRDSTRSEFQARGWPAETDFKYKVGLAYAVLVIVSGALYFVASLLLRDIVALAELVLWIIYWTGTNRLKNQLGQSQWPPPPVVRPGFTAYPDAPAGYGPPQSPTSAPAAAPSSPTPRAEQEAPSVCAGCGAALNIYGRCTACGMPVPKKQDS